MSEEISEEKAAKSVSSKKRQKKPIEEKIKTVDFKQIYESSENSENCPNEKSHNSNKGYSVYKGALSCDQINELLNVAKTKNRTYYLMILTQLVLKLREGELVNILYNNINWGAHTIHITEIKAYGKLRAWRPKTASSDRYISMPPDLENVLFEYCSTKGITTGYIFLNQRKTRFSEKRYRELCNDCAHECKSIGFNIGSHCARRTGISHNMASKRNSADVAQESGHSNPRTLEQYYWKKVIRHTDREEANQCMKDMIPEFREKSKKKSKLYSPKGKKIYRVKK